MLVPTESGARDGGRSLTRPLHNLSVLAALALVAVALLVSAQAGGPVSAQVPLDCDGAAYIMQGSNAQLSRVNTSTSPYTFTQIGPPSPYIINAIGFNSADGHLYGWAYTNAPGGAQVVSVDANGTVDLLGRPANVSNIGRHVGEVSLDGSTYYLFGGADPDLYAIDLATMTATVVTLSQAPGVADWAESPIDGLLYGVLTDTVVRVNPANGNVQTFNVPGAPGGVGGAWFGADGTFFAYENAGTLHHMDLDIPNNMASATILSSQPGPSTSSNDGTACANRTPAADVSVTKVSDPSPWVESSPLTYTVTAYNAGPDAAAPDIVVTDNIPAETAFVSASGSGWACVHDGSPLGGTVTCTRDTLLPLGPAPAITIVVTTPDTLGPSLSNGVSVTSGTDDPDPSDNTYTDVNPPPPIADLAVEKTSNPNPYIPGLPFTYEIVVSNAGPGPAIGAAVTDTLPAPLSSFTWTCAATSGSSCGSSGGTGDINTTVDLLMGGEAVFTVSGTVDAGLTGDLVNSVSVAPPVGVTDPNPDDNTDEETTVGDPQADLSIEKSSTPDPYLPGETLTYTVVVTNAGPSAVQDAVVTEDLPAALAAFTWTCSASPGSNCDDLNGTGDINTTVDLLPAGTATFVIEGTVPLETTGDLINSASVSPPPGVTDPEPDGNEVTQTTGQPEADVGLTKSVSPDPYTPGGQITYTIVVTNAGPAAAQDTSVDDDLPSALQAFQWECTATAGSSCDQSQGLGDIDTTVDLAPGGSATFVSTGQVPFEVSGDLENTAEASTAPGVTDPNPGNNESTARSGQSATTTPTPTSTTAPTNTPAEGAPEPEEASDEARPTRTPIPTFTPSPTSTREPAQPPQSGLEGGQIVPPSTGDGGMK